MASKIDIPSIIETFNCPVCYELMIPPLPQCVEGHNLCANCFYRVQSCPICRAELCIVDNNLLRDIFDMLTFPCIYEDCDEMVLGKSMETHVKQCVHRNVNCKFCDWYGKMKDMDQHFSSEHSEAVARLTGGK